MSVSITLESARLSHTTYSESLAGYPHYEQRAQRVLARDLSKPAVKKRVQDFFDWMLEHMQSAREVYPPGARFARGSAAGGLHWTFILWTKDKTYLTQGHSGCPPWWDEACRRIDEIVDPKRPSPEESGPEKSGPEPVSG
jgi:hypothetical protein